MASVPFNNLITFSRGSNATLTGPDGLIQWAPNNLFTLSEQFDNAGWNKTAVTVTANTTAAPDGTSTADAVFDTTANSLHYVQQSATLAAGQTIVISFYAKANTLSRVLVRENSITGFSVSFDLSSGTVLATNGSVTGSITSVGNGWYRCAMVQGIGTTGATAYGIFTLPAGGSTFANATYVGTGQSVYLWGAQLELGSAATTYNSTTVKNLLGFSEAFDNAAWTKTNSSIVTGAQANPVNGAFNAQKLMENTAASVGHYILQSPTAIAGTNYTMVVYAKAAERNWLHIFEDSGGSIYGFFNLSTGATGAVNNATASITNIGSGWYRCSLTYTQIGTIARIRYGVTTGNAVFTYTGDGSSGIYIYGAQLSDSASLDPYVPTPAAAPSSTAYYGPRFDYDPVTLQPKGLLVEEARTNLLTYSEQFNDAVWVKSAGGTGVAAVVTANVGVAPDGTVTADRIVFDKGAGATLSDFSLIQSAALTSTVAAHTRSVWLRTESGTATIALRALGTVTEPTDYTLLNVTSTWQRFTFTATGNTTTTGFQLILRGTYGTSNTATVQAWGAQLEAGAFATSYIPTVASTVTRSADVATISGSLFSQWYAQSAGTFVFEGDVLAASGAAHQVGFNVSGGTFPVRLRFNDQFGAGTRFLNSDASLDISASGTLAANVVYKAAAAYSGATDAALTRNGGTVGTDTAYNASAGNTGITLGANAAGNAEYINGHIRSINFIPARAADFQLQVLST